MYMTPHKNERDWSKAIKETLKNTSNPKESY
jgi:hypothetical protein